MFVRGNTWRKGKASSRPFIAASKLFRWMYLNNRSQGVRVWGVSGFIFQVSGLPVVGHVCEVPLAPKIRAKPIPMIHAMVDFGLARDFSTSRRDVGA